MFSVIFICTVFTCSNQHLGPVQQVVLCARWLISVLSVVRVVEMRTELLIEAQTADLVICGCLGRRLCSAGLLTISAVSCQAGPLLDLLITVFEVWAFIIVQHHVDCLCCHNMTVLTVGVVTGRASGCRWWAAGGWRWTSERHAVWQGRSSLTMKHHNWWTVWLIEVDRLVWTVKCMCMCV